MAESIKDRVAIVGMGCTRFGELWDKGPSDLILEAVSEACADAGIEIKDIQAAWVGTLFSGYGGQCLSETLRLQYIPVTRVENTCVSSHEAVRGASYAVAAGIHDVVLAVGFEKLKDEGTAGVAAMDNLTHTYPMVTMPGAFAILATRYFACYGLSPEEGKTMLAKISVKSHHNGALNPKAHLRREITVEQVLRAPIIAWPLGLYDCSSVCDGAAAAIITGADMAKKFRPDPVYLKALQLCVGPGTGRIRTDFDYTHIEETYRSGLAAYAEAGIKDPRREIDLVEVHDAFSINEAIELEDLQFSPRGRVKDDIDAGTFNLDGELPVQPDGGLKCFGHPVGASGLRMLYELYLQLQGRSGPRQIGNPKLGLAHNMGNQPYAATVSVCIVGL